MTGKSVMQEMAEIIARIAQARVVGGEGVSFECGQQTLKMVKTTQGYGWLLNNTLLFQCQRKAASAFYYTIHQHEEPSEAPARYNVRFGGTTQIVWSVDRRWTNAMMDGPALEELALLLKSPPIHIVPEPHVATPVAGEYGGTQVQELE
jgi:hypothetical protein